MDPENYLKSEHKISKETSLTLCVSTHSVIQLSQMCPLEFGIPFLMKSANKLDDVKKQYFRFSE